MWTKEAILTAMVIILGTFMVLMAIPWENYVEKEKETDDVEPE